MGESQNEVTWPHARTVDLSTSDRHRVLAERDRRVVLDVLADRTAPVGLGELAAAVAARESGGERADEETIELVGIRLHHNHLPMMADLGIIDYDPAATLVESCPRRAEP